jgi:hypothetical protein
MADFSIMGFGDLTTYSILLILAVLAIGVGGFFFLYSKKIGPFKWRGAIAAPYIEVPNGSVWRVIPMGDVFRVTVVDGNKMYESRRFGDVFLAGDLSQHLEWRKVGRIFKSEKGFLPPLQRLTVGSYRVRKVSLDGSQNEEIVKLDDERNKMAAAFAVMNTGNKSHQGLDFWEKYGGFVMVGGVGIIMFLSLVVVTQFVGGVMQMWASHIDANTQATLQLQNVT